MPYPRKGRPRRRTRRKPNLKRQMYLASTPREARAHGIWYDRVSKNYAPRSTPETMKLFGESWENADYGQKMSRRRHGYRGLGDYSRPRGFLGRLGNAVVGGYKGWRSGSRFSGFGDYEAEATAAGGDAAVETYGGAVDNQLIAGGNAPIAVNTEGDRTGDINFAHTEFVGNVVANQTSFENRSYAINPGLASTFPFLSQIARNFTLYEFHGLIFEFRPTSGEFGGNSNALGKVIMVTNYDPDGSNFTDSVSMENYDYATATKPSLTARHGVETAPQQQALRMNYIRTSDNVSRDKIFTDVGNFQIATEGVPNTGILGELWVTYRVKLSRSLLSSQPEEFSYAHYQATFPSDYPDSGSPIFANGVTVNEQFNNLGITIANDDGGFVFPSQLVGRFFRLQFQVLKADPNDTAGFEV